ncbi:NRAMP family divalent metal transporter [Congregibacter litoralis]|uniref:Mn2+ and Fe2+ transporter of the NRAMP family n=1 Tax=Congregibacter litoralis KT71 TaxID=314285 RepID=A4AB64_9GAMM|nr:divalent metal cation transporter [Congregibacter litoralis]EAQ96618.1 Mn2+ and Fe2+ transporter of the NRAMP family [Congregibacter litoralis KT71]
MIVRLFSNLVGPAAVMAAGTMGAGAVASFLLAGAWFRYDLLWVIVAMLPVFVVSVDTASRIGALNPTQGMFTLVRSRISATLAWLILFLVVPVHFLVTMGQISVMSSAFQTLLGVGSGRGGAPMSLGIEVLLSVVLSGAVLWLVFSRGYQRMQRVMTLLMVLMFLCFLVVALRGLVELPAILAGFVPSLPEDLPVPGGGAPRVATSSIIAMVGAAVAPAALLGMPYMCADDGGSRDELKKAFRQAIINMGFVFGAYAMFVVIAGGYALYSLPDHADFADVAQASAVFRDALPGLFSTLGPMIFSLGLFTAAMTTLVVAAQVTIYFMLDMAGREWRFTADNKLYHRVLSGFVLAAAALAPFWDFPALLKVILLMGINVIVIPLAFVIVIVLVNSRAVMREFQAEWWRNLVLVIGLLTSIVLAVDKAPHYFQLLMG